VLHYQAEHAEGLILAARWAPPFPFMPAMDDVSFRLCRTRHLPIGAEVAGDNIVSFRVWAPDHQRVTVIVEESGQTVTLTKEGDGYFSEVHEGIGASARYRLRLDDEQRLYPDPASRYQPCGHDGPSQVIDPQQFPWTDGRWRGVPPHGQVIYEMHIGTYTPEGTWLAAARELKWLSELGITVIEVMPVGEFPGTFGWGYDAVHFFAPSHLYGTPDDMRAFVDRAHALGMAVILDVIYNHCAAAGCFLDGFAAGYFTDRYRNEWGKAPNFDGENSAPVREYFVANAAYWITEFHLDGFRFDATQQIFDASPRHLLAEVAAASRRAAQGKRILLIGENEPQDVRLVLPAEEGGYGLDALWNDDFHHSAQVAATGHREAYYSDYRGAPQELVSAVKRGFLFQGQYYRWQKKNRGTPANAMQPAQFVAYLQNHDQVANSARGLRLHEVTTPGRYRALTALLLLAPHTPLLFQGQEFAASAPFLYFADHEEDMAPLARDGRAEFLSQFPSVAAGGRVCLADPTVRATFTRCKLDLREREQHAQAVALHRDLLALRCTDKAFSAQRPAGVDGAVLAAEAFVLRFFGENLDDRLLIVNLGAAFQYTPMPEPLLAPPSARRWQLIWSSEDVAYGGDGTPPPCEDGAWQIPAHAALALAAVSAA
jgi:maltooligosyltrehalose trehalohydrolase